MLVLTRRADERLVLLLPDGERITVQVVRLGRERVRLGVEAPPRVAVWREELLKEDRHANTDTD